MTSASGSSAARPAHSGDGYHGTRDPQAARIKRTAWLLGALAVGFYVFYIAWYFWRSAAGA